MDEKFRSKTQLKLINSAGPLFAENGLKGTRMREITESARVNVAGINYHFGSKDNLYKEIVEHVFKQIGYVSIGELWQEHLDKKVNENEILSMVYNYLEINFTSFFNSNHPLWYFKIIHRCFMDSKLSMNYFFEKLYKIDFAAVKSIHMILHNDLNELEIDAWLTVWYTQSIGLNILIPALTSESYTDDIMAMNFKNMVLKYTYCAVTPLFKSYAEYCKSLYLEN